MSLKCAVFIATSLDGFIARENGDLDWLPGGELPEEGVDEGISGEFQETDDGGYSDFIKDVDTLVMGRGTYEKVLTFGLWPYANLNVMVLSSNLIKFPDIVGEKVTSSSEIPQEIYSRLSGEGNKKLYIDGGKTIQRFIDAKLINEIIITQIPILIGTGISLFGKTNIDISLELIKSEVIKLGFVQTTYQVKY